MKGFGGLGGPVLSYKFYCCFILHAALFQPLSVTYRRAVKHRLSEHILPISLKKQFHTQADFVDLFLDILCRYIQIVTFVFFCSRTKIFYFHVLYICNSHCLNIILLVSQSNSKFSSGLLPYPSIIPLEYNRSVITY